MQNINTCENISQEKKSDPFSGLPGPEAIRFALQKRGRPQQDLAPIVGGKGTLSDLLSGKRPIGPKRARRLSQWLDIPFHVLRRCGA